MGKNILIIEDDQVLQDVLKVALETEGYSVTQSFNGEDGFEKIKSTNPDLILLDLVMPIRLGEWVLQQMSDEGILNKCPLIVLSAKRDEVSITNCITKYNVANYIVKGDVSLTSIIEMVKKVIK